MQRTPIRVMLLDGANNHDWKATSPVITKILDEAGVFTTTRVTVDNAELNTFAPDWSRYDVVVLNYNTGITGDAPEWLAGDEASVRALHRGRRRPRFRARRRQRLRALAGVQRDDCGRRLGKPRRAQRTALVFQERSAREGRSRLAKLARTPRACRSR